MLLPVRSVRSVKSVLILVLSLTLPGAPGRARAAVVPAVGHPHGVVAADHPLASAAGVEVLRQGGNAVDAACATAFVLGVVNPAGSGIGGGGFLLYRPAGAKAPVVLDFRETAPASASRAMYTRKGVPPGASRVGGLAVGVPGEVLGCAEALRKHGKLKLAQVLAPAIRLARRGFPTGPHLAHAIAGKREQLAARPLLARMFLPGGKPLRAGQSARRPRLARTLTAIARNGPRVFYRGWIGAEIVKAVRAQGGILTRDDLAGYRVAWRKPIQGRYREHYRVFSMPPPSSGGIAVIQVLRMLERFDLRARGHNSSSHLHVLTEAMKHAFADRARHLGDPDFVKVPVARLTSPAYLRKLSRRIGRRVLNKLEAYGSGAPRAQPGRDGGTSHISVVDEAGNAAALTTTINTGFGSLVVAGRTGIILNNQMDDFAARPGKPNAFGLVQGDKNAVAARKRPLSSMSPTIVTRKGKVVLVAGASGGPTIITGTIQAISNVLDFGLGVAAAVHRSRVHHQWLPRHLMVERDLPADVLQGLRRRGHTTRYWPHPFTAVQLVRVGPRGLRFGASDPRKMGAPAGY